MKKFTANHYKFVKIPYISEQKNWYVTLKYYYNQCKQYVTTENGLVNYPNKLHVTRINYKPQKKLSGLIWNVMASIHALKSHIKCVVLPGFDCETTGGSVD